jgi:DltD protein
VTICRRSLDACEIQIAKICVIGGICDCVFLSSTLSSTVAKNVHSTAALIALGIAAVSLTITVTIATFLEHLFVHRLAPIIFPQKNQGIALQKVALDQPDLLPFYGSSELMKPASNKPQTFFERIRLASASFQWVKQGQLH